MRLRLLPYGVSAATSLVRHEAFRRAPLLTIGRAVTWLVTVALGRERRVSVLGASIAVPPRLRKAGATSVYVLRDYCDPQLRWLASRLQPGMVVVDGGANIGLYATLASSRVGPTGHVFAFEPGRQSFEYLQRNASQPNVSLFQAALSNVPGEQRLFHVDDAPNSYSLAAEEGTESFEVVPVMTIDQALDGRSADFVKLDVEGAEELALAGASNALRHRPIVLLEVNPARARALGCEPDGALDVLLGLDYRLYTLDAGVLREATKPQSGDVIALPGA
jgi:FkbM family methyltransferase